MKKKLEKTGQTAGDSQPSLRRIQGERTDRLHYGGTAHPCQAPCTEAKIIIFIDALRMRKSTADQRTDRLHYGGTAHPCQVPCTEAKIIVFIDALRMRM